MTTTAAAERYLNEHLSKSLGKGYAVYNPHNKPLCELPKIYGFNNGGSPEWLDAVLLAEDGTCLGRHVCSHEGYMPHDLGVLEGSAPDRHAAFKKHYPDGYAMDFVPYDNCSSHKGLNKALELNEKMALENKSKEDM